MDLSDTDKATLKAAVELLWRKGTHHPQEAATAFQFTQLVERVCGPQAKPTEPVKT